MSEEQRKYGEAYAREYWQALLEAEYRFPGASDEMRAKRADEAAQWGAKAVSRRSRVV